MLIPFRAVALTLSLAAAAPSFAATPGEDYVAGQRYFTGDGVPRNHAQAAKLFRRAADADHPYAQYSLGLMYEQGYGVRKDMREALSWFERAAALGHGPARARLDALKAKTEAQAQAGAEVPASAPQTVTPTAATVAPQVVLEAGSDMPAEIIFDPAAARRIAAAERRAEAEAAPAPAAPAAAAPATTPPPVTAQPASAQSRARTPARPPQPAPPLSAPSPVPPQPVVAAATRVTGTGELRLPEGLDPATAQAIHRYRTALAAGEYGSALRALTDARVAGEITALGLNETQSAETLARLAVLAGDDHLAYIYLKQASALGSDPAQRALDQLAAGSDLASLKSGFAAEILAN